MLNRLTAWCVRKQRVPLWYHGLESWKMMHVPIVVDLELMEAKLGPWTVARTLGQSEEEAKSAVS